MVGTVISNVKLAATGNAGKLFTETVNKVVGTGIFPEFREHCFARKTVLRYQLQAPS
jgi:hypothetical protein